MKKTVKFLIMMIVVIALAVSMTACFGISEVTSPTESTYGPGNANPETCPHPKWYYGAGYYPTCTEDGQFEKQCLVCGTIFEIEITPCTGHLEDWVKETEEVPPTCGKPGETTGLYCYACQTWLKEPDVIPPTGEHEFTYSFHSDESLYYICFAGCHEDGIEGVNCYICKNCPMGKCHHCDGLTICIDALDVYLDYWLPNENSESE